MPSPGVTFAFIMATLLGVGFHLVVGGDIRRLALFLLAGWLGFALGQIAGALLGIDIFRIGSLHTLTAVAGAVTALLAARLFLIRPARRV